MLRDIVNDLANRGQVVFQANKTLGFPKTVAVIKNSYNQSIE